MASSEDVLLALRHRKENVNVVREVTLFATGAANQATFSANARSQATSQTQLVEVIVHVEKADAEAVTARAVTALVVETVREAKATAADAAMAKAAGVETLALAAVEART